jgi:hypothetical protein
MELEKFHFQGYSWTFLSLAHRFVALKELIFKPTSGEIPDDTDPVIPLPLPNLLSLTTFPLGVFSIAGLSRLSSLQGCSVRGNWSSKEGKDEIFPQLASYYGEVSSTAALEYFQRKLEDKINLSLLEKGETTSFTRIENRLPKSSFSHCRFFLPL